MPDVKISGLPASTPTSVSLSPVVTSGVTGRCTAAQLVAAGIEAGPTLKCANGSVGTPGISPLANPDTGLSFDPNTINFSTGGAQRMSLTNLGNLGIGQNPGVARLAVTAPFTNSNANLIQGSATAYTSATGSHTSHAISATLSTQVAAGQTNSGTHRGMFLACLRNSTGGAVDTGTLSVQRNMQLQYGHAAANAGMAPITAQSIGIQMQPLVQSGTVTAMTDIFIGTPLGAGTITTQYAIYQECTAANGGRNYFAGRVGCNTTTPSTALEVNGQITVSAGTLAAPSIVFATDTNTGLFSSAANTIAFVTDGVERLRLDNNLVTLTGNSLRISTASTQATSAAAGNEGEIRWDATYLYVRIQSGWRRVALGAAF